MQVRYRNLSGKVLYQYYVTNSGKLNQNFIEVLNFLVRFTFSSILPEYVNKKTFYARYSTPEAIWVYIFNNVMDYYLKGLLVRLFYLSYVHESLFVYACVLMEETTFEERYNTTLKTG